MRKDSELWKEQSKKLLAEIPQAPTKRREGISPGLIARIAMAAHAARQRRVAIMESRPGFSKLQNPCCSLQIMQEKSGSENET